MMGPYGARPVLDRLLTRIVSTASIGSSVVEYLIRSGRWSSRGSTLSIPLRDQDGRSIVLPATAPWMVVLDGNMSSVGAVEGEYVYGNLVGYKLTVSPQGVVPTDTSMQLMLGISTAAGVPVEKEVSTWCQRRSIPVRDKLLVDEDKSIVVNMVQFVVRNDESWVEGDFFTFDTERFQVQGVDELLGRKQYLSILAKSVS